MHFSLTQIQTEQGQAFYGNRGFTLKQVDDFVRSCVFMTVIRNDNTKNAIHYQLKNWQVTVNGKQQKLVLVDEWLTRLTTPAINKASLIAFKWAQFPAEQVYQPGGDWNQGMLSVGLKADQQFDIVAQWSMSGKIFTSQLKGVQCAK